MNVTGGAQQWIRGKITGKIGSMKYQFTGDLDGKKVWKAARELRPVSVATVPPDPTETRI